MSHQPTTTPPKPFKFKLEPVNLTDIPRLTHIHLITLADDPPAQIKFPSSDNFAAAVSAMLEKQIGDPKWCVMKAVDGQTGEVGSWASWLSHSSVDDPKVQDEKSKEVAGKGGEGEGEGEGEEESEDEGKFSFPPGLGAYIMNHTNALFASFSSSYNLAEYLSLRACFTLPEFERRGMATSLIRFGGKRADEMGLWTLVQASPMGKRIYEKVGFEVFDYLDVDLADERWVRNGQGDVEERFREGMYRFWYLARKPEGRGGNV